MSQFAQTLALNVEADLAFYSPKERVELNCLSSCSARELYAQRQIDCITKKLLVVGDSSLDAKTLSLFLSNNDKCRFENPQSLFEHYLLGEMKQYIYHFFNPGMEFLLSWEKILDYARTGPGSAVGAKGTDLFCKLFSSTLAGSTARLVDRLNTWASFRPRWSSALRRRSELGFETCSDPCSRLHFVPKDISIKRSICIEPTLNMFYQLGVGEIMTERLYGYCKVNLSNQQVCNARLAMQGSLDGNFCTIDLKSASDSISYDLVKALVPSWVFRYFDEIRSTHTTLPDGSRVPLKMISSMGNGFTFPLQTLIFISVLYAVYKLTGTDFDKSVDEGKPSNWGVFGDDIICTKRTYNLVTQALQFLGFTVNSEKSFSEGFFRESCGLEYYKGHNVRPFFHKKDGRIAPYVAFNRLTLASARFGIQMHYTKRFLLRSRRMLKVPFSENDDAGFKTTSTTPLRDSNGSYKYLALVPKPSVIDVSEERVQSPYGQNPDGLLLLFLSGSIRNCKLTLRSKEFESKYRTTWRVSPNWFHTFEQVDPGALRRAREF